MILLSVLQVIVGLILALFLPGFLLTKLLFDDLKILELIVLSIVFSLFIDIVIGLFLGANEAMSSITGGLTGLNIYFYILVVTIILGFILLAQNKLISKK